MDKFYFGYTLIDNFNYIFLIRIRDENIFVNDKKVIQKNDWFETDGIRIFIKNFNEVNSGKALGIYPGKNNYSKGIYTFFQIDEDEFKIIKNFKSPYSFLLKSLSEKKLKTNKRCEYLIRHPSQKVLEGMGRLSVLSFNVCSNFIWTGEQGLKDVIKIIKDISPDVVLFQEIGTNNFFKLSKKLKEYYNNNNTCILSKYSIVKELPRIPLSPIYGIVIDFQGIKINIFNSHLDDTGYDDVKLSKEYQLPNLEFGLISSVHPFSKNPSLLAGDHNTPSHLDTKTPYPVTKKLENDGWVDSYREINQKINILKDYTWPNCQTIPKILKHETGKYCPDKIKNKARIDYIYYKNGEKVCLKTLSSKVIKGKDFPSDHNSIFSIFEIFS